MTILNRDYGTKDAGYWTEEETELLNVAKEALEKLNQLIYDKAYFTLKNKAA